MSLQTGYYIRLLMILSISGIATALSQTTGSIAGTVTGDDGQVLAGVISAHRNTLPASIGHGQASAGGSFVITRLEPGVYTLCAEVSSLGYLDPCLWSEQPVTVQVGDGQAITGINVVVKKGIPLQVRLNDPHKLLGQATTGSPQVMLGVFTPRHLFQLVPQVSTDENGRNYRITVPLLPSTTSLFVAASGVQVVDQSGTDVGAGTTIPIGSIKSNSPRVITLVVQKLKKS